MSGPRLPALTTALPVLRPIRDVSIAVIAMVVVVVASAWLSEAVQRREVDPAVADVLSYVVVWGPLLLAVAVGCARMVSRQLRDRLALHARPVDLAWGLGGGLLARAVVLLATVVVSGQTGLGSSSAIDGGPQGWQTIAAIAFPVVIGPLVEEVFFRGLLQRAVEAVCRVRMSARVATATAVGVSAVLFAALHVAVEGSPVLTQTLTLGIATLVLGVVAGAIVARTGRLTGAIVAHMVFNAIAVALTWPH
ncbi:lysostaphin resistance A-like protein [Leifsonia sp. L25]|uniref:CPBP family intramembrane glutamic endopeptidase n=1 Tax=Actinomycetes TaxID=1760 RepID=UPI000EAF3577